MTAVNVAKMRLETQPGFPDAGIPIVLDWFKFCELGAVSPDYPYLDVADGTNASAWADRMHWRHAADRIQAGIGILAKMPESAARDKSLAWLLGFASHVVMDATVHPVVNLKAGEPYEQHKKAHRTCEMHQDTYIFQTRMNLNLQYASHLKHGICKCSDPTDEDRLDPDVFYLWNEMFKDADMDLYITTQPDMHAWHDCFEDIVDHIADNRLVALARHVMPGLLDGSAYPLFGDVDPQYIENLSAPGGRTMRYDDIFDRGVVNVRRAWAVVASDVLEGTTLSGGFLRNWNLDNGEDETKTTTFWS
jgi:hypothetical protein